MIPSSMRRVVASAPQSAVVSSIVASSIPRAVGAFTLSCRRNGHQRRYSSSKPSRSDSRAKELSPRQSVTRGQEEAKANDSEPAVEKRKKKAKDVEPAAKLPSVPSTQNLSQEALGLSTFFSLHRPISVTHIFPKAVTGEKFAEIFSQRNNPRKPSDVISTLSNTMRELEHPLTKLNLNQETHVDDGSLGHDEPTRIELRHADGSETSVYLQLNAMSGQFLPFRPPPTPKPQMGTDGEAVAAEETAAAEVEAPEAVPQTRTYKAILTIEETVDEDGQYKVVAHSPQLIEEGSMPRTFLERMALRQLQFEDARQRSGAYRNTMLAISVKRQKKLKIKKKKQKKLRRRMRNERRRLNKI